MYQCVSLPLELALSGTSGTNMTMVITQLEKVLMLRKLNSRLTRLWRFLTCNRIMQIGDIFVDIRHSLF